MNINNQKNIIRYAEPFGRRFRRRNRGFSRVNYNDRSPQVIAMNAHLRAAAYREGGARSHSAYEADGAQAGAPKIGSLPGLLRQYDRQARDNFAKEALLFGIITAIGFVWPVVHTMRVLLG